MDITSLVETIGNNIVQFQPTIQGVVSAVLTTLFLRKNTNISEFEKMKAGKYSEALDDLLENGKITYFELYKCQNFLKIAKIADEYHQEKQEEESKFFDFDWFMRFFDTAGNVSSEKMQRLWAKILSNEIENVGSFSLRAIETLKNMNQHEASLFQQMAHFVLTDSSESFFHDLDVMVTYCAGGQFHAVAYDVVLISQDLQRIHGIQCFQAALGHRERIVGENQLAVIVPLKHGEVGDKAQVEPILVDQIQATT